MISMKTTVDLYYISFLISSSHSQRNSIPPSFLFFLNFLNYSAEWQILLVPKQYLPVFFINERTPVFLKG